MNIDHYIGSPLRVRGAARVGADEDRARGITPRVRGAGQPGFGSSAYQRITPACAGSRRWPYWTPGSPRDHPRVCGEQISTQLPPLPPDGSPPRVRGAAVLPRAGQPALGITPARAGTRRRIRAPARCGAEDPRVCGDEQSGDADDGSGVGRPPRVRGRVRELDPDVLLRGKTPARAGTRGSWRSTARPRREDPRACGDEAAGGEWPPSGVGRPPRVRGRDPPRPDRRCPGRKTPARAGTSTAEGATEDPVKEDPRACGDERAAAMPGVRSPGRPPRVRGRATARTARSPRLWKTPARAGTSLPNFRADSCAREDPRACGDEGAPIRYSVIRRGRPPRVRGRAHRRNTCRRHWGKTPARAGTRPRQGHKAHPPREDPRACGDEA